MGVWVMALKGNFPKPRPKRDLNKGANGGFGLCISGEFVPPKPRPKEQRLGLERLGNVVWYDKQKRYGMIRDADGGREYFFHRSSLAGAANATGLVGVKPGTVTAFTIGIDQKGRECCDWVAMSPGVINCKEL